MTGWIVVNHFIQTEKFLDIYRLLENAFRERGVITTLKTNADLLLEINEPLPKDFRPESDFILFWDKDVRLAQRWERRGYRLFNRPDAIEACDDKGLTAILLEQTGIAIPKTIVAPLTFPNVGYPDPRFLSRVAERLGFPLVVKESRGSFGQQVYLIHRYEELVQKTQTLSSSALIFQEYIASSFGQDVRIQVIGNRAVAAVKRIGKPGDFRANVTNGGRMYAFEPTDEMNQIALAAVKNLNLDFAGVDLLIPEEAAPLLCEVNSNAHFRNLLDATGYDFSRDLAEYIVQTMFERQQQQTLSVNQR